MILIDSHKTIDLYNKKRDDYIKLRTEEQLKIKVEKEKNDGIRTSKKKDSEYKRQIEYIQRLKKQYRMFIKKIQEIQENYKNYQDEIIRIEEEKAKEELIEKRKLQKLIDKQNLEREAFFNLEKEYNNILINQ